MNIVVILAGGKGERLAAEVPKQFVEVFGKPVLAYTADIFQKNDAIDEIGIVSHAGWLDYCAEMVKRYALSKVQWIVPGGDTIAESILNGIRKLEAQLTAGELRLNDNILFHSGVSPFTSQRIVDAVLHMTIERGSAVSGTPCCQLLGTRDSESVSACGVNRAEVIQYFNPWGYRLSYLLDMLRRKEKSGLSNERASSLPKLTLALGDPVNYAYGDQTNIKITTPEDLLLFEGWVLAKQRRGEL